VAVSDILWHVADPHVDDVDYLTTRRVVLEQLLSHLAKNRTTKESPRVILCYLSIAHDSSYHIFIVVS